MAWRTDDAVDRDLPPAGERVARILACMRSRSLLQSPFDFRFRFVLVSVLALASLVVGLRPAHAETSAATLRPETSRLFVGVGMGAPGIGDFGGFAGLIETGYQPWVSVPLRLHAQLGVGRWRNRLVDEGDEEQLRFGVELSSSMSTGVSGFLAADIGYERLGGLLGSEEGLHGAMVGGRFGLDLGGTRWRVRVAIDVTEVVLGDFVRSDFFDSQRDYGLFTALELEVVRRF